MKTFGNSNRSLVEVLAILDFKKAQEADGLSPIFSNDFGGDCDGRNRL